ncbi:hypothetical protein AMET1_1208 [Methanonatronarchaeum thermophilum]|uniref:Uncharacterized protein n=1 Tax=Methanonatronarchaeum thermophilum TaxID=1927129 RepID=A0A1Y3GAK9_9EURY|nr:hypothetical protein [Methanonatronarchaeum thermophilum]OUJ18297.1 hypothetical protein AMET1_1208 [Methanonatronarchaeum thermophilum]
MGKAIYQSFGENRHTCLLEQPEIAEILEGRKLTGPNMRNNHRRQK